MIVVIIHSTRAARAAAAPFFSFHFRFQISVIKCMNVLCDREEHVGSQLDL